MNWAYIILAWLALQVTLAWAHRRFRRTQTSITDEENDAEFSRLMDQYAEQRRNARAEEIGREVEEWLGAKQ